MLASIKQEAQEAVKEGALSSTTSMKQRELRKGRSTRLKGGHQSRRMSADAAASCISSPTNKRNPYTMSLPTTSGGGSRIPRRRRASNGADFPSTVPLSPPSSPTKDKVGATEVSSSHEKEENEEKHPASPRNRTQKPVSPRRRRSVEHGRGGSRRALNGSSSSRRDLLDKASPAKSALQSRRMSLGASMPALSLEEADEELVPPESPRRQSRRASLDALGTSFRW